MAKAIVFIGEDHYFNSMSKNWELPFFLSIPHSGEQVPDNVAWLQNLPEVTLMRDVDRYVDKLYQPAINDLNLPNIVTQWHRYVVDLNRKEDQYDATAVVGAPLAAGKEPKGLHWSQTTHGEILINEPMTQDLHNELVQKYYKPFHQQVQKLRQEMLSQFKVVYHLDLHSMPSVGTSLHTDPGQERPEIVVSDYHGEKSNSDFRDIVMKAYQEAGFQVGYNFPYVGGGITRMYGEPEKGFNTIQIEMNRKLYMNEETKMLNDDTLVGVQKKLSQAISKVKKDLGELING